MCSKIFKLNGTNLNGIALPFQFKKLDAAPKKTFYHFQPSFSIFLSTKNNN